MFGAFKRWCWGRLGTLGAFGGITIHVRCLMKY